MLQNPGDSHASVRYFFGMTWFFDSLIRTASCDAVRFCILTAVLFGNVYIKQYGFVCSFLQCGYFHKHSVIRSVAVSDTAFSGDDLKPDTGVQILTAADVSVVVVIAFAVVDTQSGAQVIIPALPDKLPCVAGGTIPGASKNEESR